ncbi:MAG: COX aromatic rich motif-containing protein [Halioglobus sp.]|nr:COX aromatic rich motif-containing protein [Halioglobus sp.]
MRRHQKLTNILVRSTGGLLLLMLSVTAAASNGFINPAGPIAEALRDHLIFIVVVMAVVIVPLFIALPWTLWRYRLRTKSGSYQPNWEFSWPLEILIWGLPAVIVVILGWNLWHQSYELDPYKPLAATEAPLEIQAIALDWKWVFIYPEQNIASVNEVMIVAGRPVHFSLTSGTVMQSFMIPRLGGQIYTMAGMVTQMNLLASEPGQFRGLNTQYNGMGFANQKFMANAVSQTDFDAWATKMSDSKPPLNSAAWALLAKPSVLPAPQSFGSVAEGLFTGVIAGFTGGHPHMKADGTDL